MSRADEDEFRVQKARRGACRRGGLIKGEQRMSGIQRPGGWSEENKPKRFTFGFKHLVYSRLLAVLTFGSGRKNEM